MRGSSAGGGTKLLGVLAGALLAVGAPALAVDLSRLAIPDGPVAAGAAPLSRLQAGRGAAAVAPELRQARGEVEVWVKLAEAPLAEAHGANAKTRGGKLSLSERRAYLQALDRRHDAVSAAAGRLGGRELGRVSRAHNAVALRIDASRLAEVASLPGVVTVRPVHDYQLALSEVVPYVGAAATQAAGKDGAGARVAVFDSGIDYTHKNLGGPGTAASYAEAVAGYPNAYFPSAKVVGGYDFVGSAWTGASGSPARTEDPNPIDDGPGGGHGTHVADIVAGRSLDGTHVGVAPGATLYAVKVCSSVSTSCNGVALLKAVDFALDPDGDGRIEDAVDVINLSLGSNYGMKEDDLTEALNQASAFGVVVVAAAGNAGNRPYIVSSPSIGPPVISVAQTQVPSAKAYPLVVNSPAAIAGTYANTATVDWAPVDRAVTGDVAYVGTGCPGETYLADPAGKVALISRGICSVSLKVDGAAKAGAVGVLIGLVSAGDAVSFSNGGGTTFVPTLVITQATATAIRANLAAPVNVTISPASAIPLAGSMVSSSARGPSMSLNAIKPEIGAPGASVSAVYGTGDGQEAFGGTSGATPVIAGSAAILVGALPGIEPLEVKSRLMNTAQTAIYTNPALAPGQLARITRIGAGEVRVNRALSATAVAWVEGADSAALSYGYHATPWLGVYERRIQVKNKANQARTFSVATSFRTAAAEASGAVEVLAPRSIRVGARKQAAFSVVIVVHPEKLPDWILDGGGGGGDGTRLDAMEVDGYVTLSAAGDQLTLPWHVLPHKAAAVLAADQVRAGGSIRLFNGGVAPGTVEAFSLTGRSPALPASQLPAPGDGFAVVDLRAVGARLADPSTLQFGISTFGARAHPNYPAEFDVYVDTDLNGQPDYVIFNAENGGFGASGQNLVYVASLATGVARAYYYVDASLDSSNAILTVPLTALGLTADSTFGFSVYAFDNYFSGAQTDAVEGMTYTPSRPRWAASAPTLEVPARGAGALGVTAVSGGAQASPSQTGLLLLYRDSDPRLEAQLVTVRE